MYDVDILNLIYIIVKDRSMIHTTFKRFPGEICKPFPTPYDKDYRFVGEYVYEDESRSNQHINILKKALRVI